MGWKKLRERMKASSTTIHPISSTPAPDATCPALACPARPARRSSEWQADDGGESHPREDGTAERQSLIHTGFELDAAASQAQTPPAQALTAVIAADREPAAIPASHGS